MDSRTVLLIKSREIGWVAVEAALRDVPGVRVVGESRCVARGVELAATLNPDVVLAPARLDGQSTRPVLGRLRTAPDQPPLVLLFGGSINDEELADDGLGIDGHLLWSELSADTLKQVLVAFLSGEVAVASRSVLEAFVRSRNAPSICPGDSEKPVLTPREQSVLAGLVRDLSRTELAAREGLSVRTVERVIAGLHTKMEATSPYALIARAFWFGLVDECQPPPGRMLRRRISSPIFIR